MQDSKEVDATSAFLSNKAVRNIFFLFWCIVFTHGVWHIVLVCLVLFSFLYFFILSLGGVFQEPWGRSDGSFALVSLLFFSLVNYIRNLVFNSLYISVLLLEAKPWASRRFHPAPRFYWWIIFNDSMHVILIYRQKKKN